MLILFKALLYSLSICSVSPEEGENRANSQVSKISSNSFFTSSDTPLCVINSAAFSLDNSLTGKNNLSLKYVYNAFKTSRRKLHDRFLSDS